LGAFGTRKRDRIGFYLYPPGQSKEITNFTPIFAKSSGKSPAPDYLQMAEKLFVLPSENLFSQTHLPVCPIVICQRGPGDRGKKSLSSGNVCANIPGKSWRFLKTSTRRSEASAELRHP
jgi:hypothetical protein